ncbi:MAG: hypothetical protein L0206_01610 [Actinobacteria bacterium]|nr:hypothetical protein [Actinomycetota bacterium]
MDELTLETDEIAVTHGQATGSDEETAQTRLEHSALLRFDAFLSRRSPGFIILLAFLLVACSASSTR